jgi:hypothetical protein
MKKTRSKKSRDTIPLNLALSGIKQSLAYVSFAFRVFLLYINWFLTKQSNFAAFGKLIVK